VINTNLHVHPIVYCFEVIADYCSNFGGKTVTLHFERLFDLLHCTWPQLNCFQTGRGRACVVNKLSVTVDNHESHIINTCPLTTFEGVYNHFPVLLLMMYAAGCKPQWPRNSASSP